MSQQALVPTTVSGTIQLVGEVNRNLLWTIPLSSKARLEASDLTMRRNCTTWHWLRRSSSHPCRVARWEKKKYDQQIDPSDMPEYRSVGGCLQWLSGRCRPDVAATTSLCSKGTKATYKGLALMYQAVEHLHATKEMGINMFPTTINENSVLVSFSDSSWANAEGFASQHGSLTLIADPRVLDSIGPGIAGLEIFTVEPHLPLYSSCRSQRCRCECG